LLPKPPQALRRPPRPPQAPTNLHKTSANISATPIHAVYIFKMASIAKHILPPLFHSQKVGVVVSAGKMAGAVKVRVADQEWNKKFRKVDPHLHTATTTRLTLYLVLSRPKELPRPRPQHFPCPRRCRPHNLRLPHFQSNPPRRNRYRRAVW
jgi:hypothetical protein